MDNEPWRTPEEWEALERQVARLTLKVHDLSFDLEHAPKQPVLAKSQDICPKHCDPTGNLAVCCHACAQEMESAYQQKLEESDAIIGKLQQRDADRRRADDDKAVVDVLEPEDDTTWDDAYGDGEGTDES